MEALTPETQQQEPTNLNKIIPCHHSVPPTTKIIVIEDSLIQAKTIRRILNELGYKDIHLCPDSVNAVEIIKKLGSQLVFCDWDMPHKTGLMILKELRQDEAIKGLPFIMLTANSDKPHVIEAFKCGVNDYIIKPLVSATLEEKLSAIKLPQE